MAGMAAVVAVGVAGLLVTCTEHEARQGSDRGGAVNPSSPGLPRTSVARAHGDATLRAALLVSS
jgi:hypothetical protein